MTKTSNLHVSALRGSYAADVLKSITRERRLSSAYAKGAKTVLPAVDEGSKVETFPKSPAKTARFGPCEPKDFSMVSGRSISEYEQARRADLDVNIALTSDEGRAMLERLGAFDLTAYKARKMGVSKRLMAEFARETVCESLPAYDRNLLKLTDRLEDLPREIYQAQGFVDQMTQLAVEAAPDFEAVEALEVAAANAAQIVAALQMEAETTMRQIEWMRGVVKAEYQKIADEQQARLTRANQKAYYERHKGVETPARKAERKKRQDEARARYMEKKRAARKSA